jgi:hypothetical protein
MKKVLSCVPKMIVAATIMFAVACNGAQTHDDTNRVDDDKSGTNHPDASDTTMTDTTRNITSGLPDTTTK